METLKQHITLDKDLALESEVLRNLWQKALVALQSLQTPLGIAASGPNDHFHAIFGRDSLWTLLLALEAGRLQQAAQWKLRRKIVVIHTHHLFWLLAPIVHGYIN